MLRKTMVLGLLAAAFVSTAEAQLSARSNDKTKSLPIKIRDSRVPAPDFRLPAREGGVRRLSDYRGKWLLLNFWATWCGPCRDEMPALSRAQERWTEKASVVGVSMDSQGWQKITPFLARYPVKYEILLGNPKVARAYGAGNVYPTTVLVDPEGRIVGEITTALEEDSIHNLLRVLVSNARPVDPHR